MNLSKEQLQGFLDERTPRFIPRPVKRMALRTSAARGLWLIGTIFLLISLPMLYFLFPRNLHKQIIFDLGGKTMSVSGKVTRVEKTSMSEGKGSSKRRIYRLYFNYKVKQKSYENKSYSTSRNYHTGQKVTVNYLPDSPAVSSVSGCRMDPFGYLSLFFMAFPILGTIFVLVSIRSRMRILNLLRNGVPASGIITDITATKVRVNNQQQHKITISYEGDYKHVNAVFKAYGNTVSLAKEKMLSNEKVPLLYDQGNPERILPLISNNS
jgi:hypothetical protein